MHCVTVIYPKPADPDHFKSYYEGSHVPLASKLPGLRKSSFAYPQMLTEGDAFCIFQGYFDDAAAMEAAFASDIGKEVAGDIPHYSPAGCLMFHFPAAD